MQHTSKQHFDFDGELAGNHSIAIELTLAQFLDMEMGFKKSGHIALPCG